MTTKSLKNSSKEVISKYFNLVFIIFKVQTIKMQAQEHIRQLNKLFDVEDNSRSEMRVKELEDQIVALKTVNSDLESISKKFEQVTSCSLCDEKYESTGERAPVKLKCSHVFCSKCSYNWLKSQVFFIHFP
jgi:hypothetical protein